MKKDEKERNNNEQVWKIEKKTMNNDEKERTTNETWWKR